MGVRRARLVGGRESPGGSHLPGGRRLLAQAEGRQVQPQSPGNKRGSARVWLTTVLLDKSVGPVVPGITAETQKGLWRVCIQPAHSSRR